MPFQGGDTIAAMKRPEGTGPGASPGVGRAGLHDDEVEQALVAAEDARAEAGAAIRERDAMAVALAAARAEADGLRA